MKKPVMTTAWRKASVPMPHAALVILTPLLLVIDTVWCVIGHWTIVPQSLAISVSVPVLLLTPLLCARYRHDERIRIMLACTAHLILFCMASLVLGCLIVSTNASLVDMRLARWDLAMGFYWPDLFTWVKERPLIDVVLDVAYVSTILQITVVTLYLSYTRRFQALTDFVGLYATTLLATVIIGGVYPAAGPFKYYSGVVHADASMLSHFEPLRSGALRSIDFFSAQGLVSIPSFHTIVAVLLMYAMRETRMRWLFILLNILVIASTPTSGGHYLVDLIAGGFVAASAILMWNWRTVLYAGNRQLSVKYEGL